MKTKRLFADCKTRYLALLTVLTLLFTIGSGNAWGDTYTITFATGSGDGTKASTSTAASTCTTAATYVTGNLVTASNVYYGGSNGLKLGTKSGAGDIKINLSTTGQVVPTKVSVYAKYYSSSNKRNVQLVTNLGSTTATTTTGSFTEYSHTYSGSTKLSYIEIKSSGYIWVEKVVVTYTAAAPTYTLKVPNGTGGYTTYSNKVKSDLTQETAEGGNSCGVSGLDGTYSGWRVGALESPAASPGTTYSHATAGDMPASGSTLYAVFRQTSGSYYYHTNPLCVPACANSVTIQPANGTGTNCTFTVSPNGAQASCDGVTTTVSVTPTTGYGTPVVSESGATPAATVSGTTVTYAANTTGTSTISVSCSANNYTITLDKDLTPTTAGTASITATYNASTNLTSAITKPTKTGWTFGGYFTAKNGGGTQIIDASGNVIASVSGYTDASRNWKYAGNITLYAKWTCTVTWSVNGLTNVYSTQTVTYNSSGSKVASVPTPDPASYCGDIFAGWSRKNAGAESKTTSYYDDLFKTIGDSPDIKSIGNITFYAVFADEK